VGGGGGNERSRNQMEAFQKTLEECELTDLGFYGPKYTWRNCREGEDFIKERLDRGMANQAWRDIFPSAEVQVEAAVWSDHSPIFLRLSGMVARERRMGQKFRHEASWILEEEYSNVVKQVWGKFSSGTSHWDRLAVKMRGCRMALLQWQRRKKDLIYKELKTKLLKIQEKEGLSSRDEEKKYTKGITNPFGQR
jgi:hypothetical protein